MSDNPFSDDPIDDNPYQPPIAEAQVVGILSNRREDLRAVATYQRGIIVCILIYLIFVFLQFGIPPEFRFVLGLILLPLGIIGTVLVFLLSTKVYGVGIGIGYLDVDSLHRFDCLADDQRQGDRHSAAE